MRTLKSVLRCVLVVTATSCSAATNDLEEAILSFPDVSATQFRPDQAVRSANMLIRAGQSSACASLLQIAPQKEWLAEVSVQESQLQLQPNAREWQAQEDTNRKICHLCRLLFTSKNEAAPLRPPGLGSSSLVSRRMLPEDWPYLPFVISDGVPLSVTEGYNFQGGIPERARDYLSYCLAQGAFRTEPFPEPTFASASNALVQVLTSPWWKAQKWNAPQPGVTWLHQLGDSEAEGIKAFAAERLWDQVQKMANSTNRLSRATGSNP